MSPDQLAMMLTTEAAKNGIDVKMPDPISDRPRAVCR